MTVLDPDRHEQLLAWLSRSRDLGFIGPGPVDSQVTHSLAFANAWGRLRSAPPARILDLGSGGGLPGLVLAEVWPSSAVFLLEVQRRRATFLREALAASTRSGGSSVVEGRAEEVAHGPLRDTIDLVTARGFGLPAVVAECAVGFLRKGALLLVSEPPLVDPARWPGAPLARLGLRSLERLTDPTSVVCLERSGLVPPHVPRRIGLPRKRPLWALEESRPPRS